MKTTILKLIDDQIKQESDYIREHEQIKAILKLLEGQNWTFCFVGASACDERDLLPVEHRN